MINKYSCVEVHEPAASGTPELFFSKTSSELVVTVTCWTTKVTHRILVIDEDGKEHMEWKGIYFPAHIKWRLHPIPILSLSSNAVTIIQLRFCLILFYLFSDPFHLWKVKDVCLRLISTVTRMMWYVLRNAFTWFVLRRHWSEAWHYWHDDRSHDGDHPRGQEGVVEAQQDPQFLDYPN